MFDISQGDKEAARGDREDGRWFHVCQHENQRWSLALPEEQERPFRATQKKKEEDTQSRLSPSRTSLRDRSEQFLRMTSPIVHSCEKYKRASPK